jgi:hypothetical protein
MYRLKLSVVFSIFFIANFLTAQITTPSASPSSKLEQKVGLTDIKLDYSRPSAKGRTIFGGKEPLVQYDNLWRTGANNICKISFSDDVVIEGQSLKKGEYGILTKPNATSWLVNFYTYEGSNWSTYIPKTPAVSVSVVPKTTANHVETFTIDINNIETSKGTILMSWEKTVVPVNFVVEVDKAVMANIEKVMAGPTSNDYYNAASYYHDSHKDLEQALEWVRKATKVDAPKFWQVRKEALILADLGRFKEAIVAAKLSKDLATTADNQEYVKMNEKSIAEWMKK